MTATQRLDEITTDAYGAIARAVNDSGIQFVTGYRGMLASSILESISDLGMSVEQVLNESHGAVAAHVGSYLGIPSVFIAKNAGFNHAALPVRNACDLGANAPLVAILTDDVLGAKSENTQDGRAYADTFGTLVLEPSTVQQAYAMVMEATRVSGEHGVPVIIRVTNELFNREEKVVTSSPPNTTYQRADKNQQRWVLHPTTAVSISDAHQRRLGEIAGYVEGSDLSTMRITGEGEPGLIYSQATDPSRLAEALQDRPNVLNIGTFPLPRDLVRQFYTRCGGDVKVLDDSETSDGGHSYLQGKVIQAMGPRIPRIDPPHRDPGSIPDPDYSILFHLLGDQSPGFVGGDFGLTTLATGSQVEYGLHYGGGVMTAVAAAIHGVDNTWAVVGDGGLSHGGYNGLIEANRKNSNVNIVVVDNGGITGSMRGREPTHIEIEKQLEGYNNIRFETVNYEDLTAAHLNRAREHNGPSVLLVKYEQ